MDYSLCLGVKMSKLEELFGGMIVKKDCTSAQFSSLSIPAFIRDWFIRKYADKDGNVDSEFVAQKIKEILPRKENLNKILNKLYEGESVKFLAKVEINIDIRKNSISFAINDLGIEHKDTCIMASDWEKFKDNFLSTASSVWGIVTLKKAQITNGKKQDNKIALVDFKNFVPYTVDTDYFKKAREQFDIDEWIDIVLGAIDYNPASFADTDEKLMIITRLLPFAVARLNLIELAPKGTGKSYMFSQISKFGWLSSGGVMSRAKLFYDMSKKQEGLVSCWDFVALDEISTINFPDVDELRGAMKGYLESGTYSVGNKLGKGNAGIVLLGNIAVAQMDTSKDMFSFLPEIFHDSALIDRFHGFIEGWKIPRMKENRKANDWALNSEYFSSVLHELREDVVYNKVIDELVGFNSDADTRDVTAVKRIANGFLKILFPHYTSQKQVDKEVFEKYCLNPAINMRKIVKNQMAIMDDEYKDKPFPEFFIK